MQKALEHLLGLSEVKRRNVGCSYLSFSSSIPSVGSAFVWSPSSRAASTQNPDSASALQRGPCALNTAALCMPSLSVCKGETLANIRGSIYFVINLIAHKLHLPIGSWTFLGVLQLYDCSCEDQGKSCHKCCALQSLEDHRHILWACRNSHSAVAIVTLSVLPVDKLWLLQDRLRLQTQGRMGWGGGLRLCVCV